MNAASIAKILLSLGILMSLASACGRRSNPSNDSPSLDSDSLDNQAVSQSEMTREDADKLSELIKDQSEALDKLSADRKVLIDRLASLNAQINSLNDQLATNLTLTIAQKVEMRFKISNLGTEKATLDQIIADLNATYVDLQKRLDANVQLQKDLEAAKKLAEGEAEAFPDATETDSTAKYYSFKYTDPSNVKRDCLAVSASSNAENATLVSSPCGSSTSFNQQFSLIDPANQFFQIKARHSEKCLVASALTEAAAVLQKTCTTDLENNWEFYDRGQSSFRLRNQYSGKCIKIAADGKIIQGDCATNSSFYSWFIAD